MRGFSPEGEARVALADEAATLALGDSLAGHLVRGDVVALSGGLGAGKTTLVRGLVAGLARQAHRAQETVPSPSFSIVQTYEFAGFELWHFDFFRLKSPAELAELGWEEALASGATIVEWPERVPGALPESHLVIRLEWAGAGRLALLSGRLNVISVANLAKTFRTYPELS
jgi:tRNA threonylcarbamoyl adenosine modification protein YjeE